MSISAATKKIAWFLVCLFFFAGGGHLVAQAKYRQTSVCEILSKPNVWDRRSVSVVAELVVARPHGIFLVDEHCSKKGGLQLDYPSTGIDQSVSDLDHLILSGDLLQGATGTFCGLLKRDVGSKHLYMSLRSVLGLKPKTGPDASNPSQDAAPTMGGPQLR